MLEQNTLDTFGQRTTDKYSSVILDPDFEDRLKCFDDNLRLVFNQVDKKWNVLEWNFQDRLWNIIVVAEDEEGNPKPLGEWIFNRLWVYRKRWEEKKARGVDAWLADLRYQAEKFVEKEDEKISDNNKAALREDVVQWRKAAKELDGSPTSDATAGYRKAKT